MKKILMPLLIAVLIVPCVLFMTACSFQPVETINGRDGTNGLTPHIGTNGNWWIGTTDTGILAVGQNGTNGQNGANGLTPYIGENLMWWIGEYDLGIRAVGEDGFDGLTPHIGADGYWYIGNQKTGHYAVAPYIGANGTWWYGTTDTGIVAVGKDAPIPHIFNGNWWIGTHDTGFAAIGQNGKDGQNGITPHIGANGNWWYGDLDTGFRALGESGKNGADGKNGTDGLTPFIYSGTGTWWIGSYDTGVVANFNHYLDQIAILQNYITELNNRLNYLDSLLNPAPVSFSIDSWATIANVSNAGLAPHLYNVGDEKTIMLNDGEIVTFVILGFNHDDLTSGGKAGITLGTKGLLQDGTIANEEQTNEGGWADSYMRNITMGEIFDRLPTELQAVIKTVNKSSTIGTGSTDTVITADKLFMFARTELDGITEAGYVDEGTQYEYWVDKNTNNDRMKRTPSGDTVGGIYRLRSASTFASARGFIAVNPNGGFNTGTGSTQSMSIYFGFCV